jgi:hypothetical protein
VSSVIAYASSGGLGNRVRVVLSAKRLAIAEGRQFSYVWPTSSCFQARLDDLWSFDEPTVPGLLSLALALRYPYRDPRLRWLDESARREPVWQFRTGEQICRIEDCPSWSGLLRSLSPVPSVRERVERLHRERLAGHRYVAVMIRAHPSRHAKTAAASPVDWFTDRMLAIRRVDPQIRFFLSCDVPAVQRHVEESVDGCYALDDKGGYNTVEGLRSAVADLYLAAGSWHILAAYYSSFATLARRLTDPRIPFETAVGGSAPLDLSRVGAVADPLRPFDRE